MIRSVVLSLVLISGWAAALCADDWPQWMGPGRDDVWKETGIIESIPKEGLKVLWRVPVGGGYSGPAVVGDRVYVTDYQMKTGLITNNPGGRDELTGDERVLCIVAKTGDVVWEHSYDRPYKLSYPSGPRATPTVVDGKVYSLGAEGNLLCLDAAKGDVVWSKDLPKDYSAPVPVWGFSGHPLVDGNKLICLVGGKGSVAVAFDKETGQEIWKALSASESGYAPPSIIEAGGVRQLLVWDADKINALNPETGEVYWSEDLKPSYGMSIMAPRKEGDLLFASGIGNVGAVYRLASDKPAAELVWKGDANKGLYAANSTPMIEEGVIYGVCCQQGQLRGVQLADGKRLWQTFAPTTGGPRGASHGTAFLTRHESNYYLFNETGDLIQAKLSREGYEELGRFHVLEPTQDVFGRKVVWSHPAFANKCLFARNDKELVCVSLAAE
jgi:outer membrane protein assembly factor BamB